MQGSAPSLNPLTEVSDEGVAVRTRGRVRSPNNLPKPPLFLNLRHYRAELLLDNYFDLVYGSSMKRNRLYDMSAAFCWSTLHPSRL